MRISGNTFLITGGSSGLGEATARLLLSKGANVVLFDLNLEKGQALQAELGPQSLFVRVDVASEASVQQAIDEAVKKFGSISGVINCAGVASAITTVTKSGAHPLDAFEFVMKVNLLGTFNVSRLVALQCSRQPADENGERGVIINTASVAAFEGQKGQVAYSASKGAVVGMTLPMARDLARFGVRVVTIAPGIFETPMVAAMPEKVQKSLQKDIPLARFGKSPEFALAAAAIIENPYMNGTTVRVDGGVRMSNL